MAFPPLPVYPDAIDSDYTLYLVHNTTETRITVDNSAWAQEIEIVPVADTKTDIWSDNGFANIDGELLYYDDVERNSYGKVIKLKKCSRQLGGSSTKFNPKGTWIRSYVVAEHHNQIANAILKAEDFIGYNFDPRPETLDWRIRNLEELEIIFDDFDCPDIVFTWNIVENSPVTGIVASYAIEINPGWNNEFRLDFGDGNFTTTELTGTHTYSVNAKVDPVITVTNEKCQVLQTPVERIHASEPPVQIDTVFEIPIPEIPDIPDFIYVPVEVPEADVQLPPMVFPCVSIEGQLGPIPSVITGPDINLPSQVTITGPDNPIQVLHSKIEITGGPINVPPVILIDPPIPPTVIIDPPIPPTIVIVPPQSQITLELEATELPRLEVDWGRPPEMEVALTLARRVQTPALMNRDTELVKEFGEEFADLFEASTSMSVQYESVGIPEEIRVIFPDVPDIKFNTDNFPTTIKVDFEEVKIPTEIQIFGPETPIPTSIRFDASEVPESVDLIYKGQPIPIDITGFPKSISVELSEKIPDSILIEMPQPIPEKIILQSELPDRIVLDAPKSIMLEIPENIGIPVIFPEKMPELEVVYKGSPIELKITMDQIMSQQADGKNCVMIVPCQA